MNSNFKSEKNLSQNNKNLQVIDLKAVRLNAKFFQDLKVLSGSLLEKKQSDEFTLLRSFLESKGIKTEKNFDYSEYWYIHLSSIRHLFGSVVLIFFNGTHDLDNKMWVLKNGSLTPDVLGYREAVKYEINSNDEKIEIPYLEEVYISKGGLTILKPIFEFLVTQWFSLPSLINDFCKYSLEKNKPIDVEIVLLKFWLEIPAALNEVYCLLLLFAPETFLQRNEEDKLTKHSFMRENHISPVLMEINYTTDVNENGFFPHALHQITDFLVYEKKIPSNLIELLSLYKESQATFKPRRFFNTDNDFTYFYDLLEKNLHLIKNDVISEGTWKLLVYNPPVPMSYLKWLQNEFRLDELTKKDPFSFS